jgi:glycoside/pentoside/hexuronide:cation symporter, GPH family
MEATQPRPPLGLLGKILYGAGAAASGIKQRAIVGFMLLFYNQVIGLPAATVALIMTVTVVFDALVDPVMGQISDNFRSRWGRRHPFMYASAIPVAVIFFLIFNPPAGWSDGALSIYLLVCLLALGLFDTFFELPSSALLPELALGYVERARLAAMRTVAAGLGPLLVTVLGYQYFLKENAAGRGGVLDQAGYLPFSLFFAGLIFIIIVSSAAGTHRQIPYLRQPVVRKTTVAKTLKEMAGTLRNPSFLALVVAGILSSVGLGLRNGLDIYFGLYFWELPQSQLAILGMAGAAGAVIGAPLAPSVIHRLGKKQALIIFAAIAQTLSALPIALRLIGVMPENDSPWLFRILLIDSIIHVSFAMVAIVSLTAMLADVVEDVEVKTGRRSEGLLFAADNFFKKMVSSVGVLLVGMVLALAQFPSNVERGEVPTEILNRMALIYLPLLVVLIAGYLIAVSFYRIDRGIHEDNLNTLKARGTEGPAAGPATTL